MNTKWLIPFSWEEIKVWDTIVRCMFENKWTKWEDIYEYDRYKVIDIDYENKHILHEYFIDNVLARPIINDDSNIYFIDRRPRYKRLFNLL